MPNPMENLKSQKRGGRPGEQIPKGYRTFNIENMDESQRALLAQRIQELGPDNFLARLAAGDESLFEELEAPAMRQFSELQGGLASRFSGMGTGGRKSSGFQNTATAAGSNFAQDLQAQRLGLRNQALTDLHGMSNNLLQQRPYERGLIEKPQKKPSFLQSVAGPLLGSVPGAIANYATGGASGAASYAAQGISRGYQGSTQQGESLARGYS